MSLQVQILGVPQAIAAMQHLTPAVRIRWFRQALNKAGGVIKRQIVANAPRDTSLLARSQRVKVIVPQASRNPKHHDKPATAIIGVGRGLLAVISKRGKAKVLTAKAKAAAKVAGTVTKRASRYSHLVEKKTHYMSDAVVSANSAANAAFARKIAQGIQAEAARLASKP